MRIVTVQSASPSNKPAGPATAYDPDGTVCGTGWARVVTTSGTGSVVMPPMSGLGSAQRTRTTVAETGEPVALAT